MNTPAHRAGHVAVIGRPNVGKSTLVNALVGAKVSITSSRPQTTRHRLLGIATFDHGQLLLVDTPGIHREQGKASSSAMHRYPSHLSRCPWCELEGQGVVYFVDLNVVRRTSTGRRRIAGRMLEECAMTIEMMNPRNTAWMTVS